MTRRPARKWIVGTLVFSLAVVCLTFLLTGDDRDELGEAATRSAEQSASPATEHALRMPAPIEGEASLARRPIEGGATPIADEPAATTATAPAVPNVFPQLPPDWKTTLFGDVSVVGAEETRADSVELRLVDQQGVEYRPDTVGQRYEFVDLEAGRYWLQAGGPRQRPIEQRLDLLEKENRRVDLELVRNPALTLTATTNDGQPLVWALEDLGMAGQGLYALAVPWPDPDWRDVASAQGFARFISQAHLSRSLRGQMERRDRSSEAKSQAKSTAEVFGSLELMTDEPVNVGLFLHRRRIAWLPCDPSDDRLAFRVDVGRLHELSGRLEVHVVDAATGAFLEGGSYAVDLDFPRTVHDLEQGKLVREPCPVGEVLFTLAQPGYGNFHRTFEVTGHDDEPHVLRLTSEPDTFRVRVLWPDGTPAAGASVSYVEEQVVMLGYTWVGQSERTDAAGWIELPLPTRARMLYASAREFDHYQFAEVTVFDRRELPRVSSRAQRVSPDEKPGNVRTLQLLASSELCLVPDPAFADGSFRLFDPQGYPLRAGVLRGSAPKLLQLVPDLYRLDVYDRQDAGPWTWMIELGTKPLEWPIGP